MLRREGLLAVAVAATLGLTMASPAMAAPGGCGAGKIRTGSGCTTFAAAGRGVRRIVGQEFRQNGLRAVIGRIDVGNRTLARFTRGESMAGVPASLRMHFRIGSMAIPYLMDLLLQLQDKGRLSLDDPISKWFPGLPNAHRVTLRMLASATSGYPDWVQGNPAFQTKLVANPFRQWTTRELLDTALARPLICDPGKCFHYAHTGFVILGRVVHKVTHQPLARVLQRRVMRPLGLRHTQISALPAIPGPVLHSYLNFRGPYEDATYWSPSWGISASLTMTSTIADVMKSTKALVTGALVSRSASRQRIASFTVGLPPLTKRLYYGLGLEVAGGKGGWLVQNPDIDGWTSIQAALPSRRIALAYSVTLGPKAANSSTNFSEQLLVRLTRYLSPRHVAVLPDAS